jgi:hypothetical protein
MIIDDKIRNTDIHLNIFQSYSQGGIDNLPAERILENNVTRGLMCCLSQSKHLTDSFITEFCGNASKFDYKYELQSNPSDIKELKFHKIFVVLIAENKTLVSDHQSPPKKLIEKINDVILKTTTNEISEIENNENLFEIVKLRNLIDKLQKSIKGEDLEIRNNLWKLLDFLTVDPRQEDGTNILDNHSWLTEVTVRYLYDLTFGSRPDALIWNKEICVLIESKIHGPGLAVQIERHKRENFGNQDVAEIDLTWRDNVYSLFKRELKENHEVASDPIEHFLVNQFIEYLEVNGMSPFDGFAEKDFRFCLQPDNDYKPIIKGKINELGDKIREKLRADISVSFIDSHVGIIKKQDAGAIRIANVWYVLRKITNGKPFTQCNFEVGINSDGVFLGIVIREGTRQDKKAIGKLYRILTQNPENLQNVFKALNNEVTGIELDIFKRQRGPDDGRGPLPGTDFWLSKAVLPLDPIDQHFIDYFLDLLENNHLPGIHLGKTFRKNDPLLKKPEELIDKGMEIWQGLYPVMEILEKS